MTKTQHIIVLSFFLLFLMTAVYWDHFDNGFHFDDIHTIVSNGYITDIDNLPLFFTDPVTGSNLPTNRGYRPIVTSLNAFDYWLAGELDSRFFHWHIYLEFLVLLVLLYFLLSKIYRAATGSDHRYAALFGCALFGFHTATAETINYIIARSDEFSTLMVLAGLLLYTSQKGLRKHLGLIPFVIGCLAKPTTLMLAPLLFVFAAIIERPSITVRGEGARFWPKLRDVIAATWSYLVVGIVMYLFTRSMYPDNWTPGGNYSSWHYLNTQAYVVWVYVKTFFIPVGLTADTDLTIIREFLAPRVLWGLFVIVLMLGAALMTSMWRRMLPIAYGILWFFIALAPSSSVIPLAEVMNHHRTFFPYIGLVMAAVWMCNLAFLRLAGERPTRTARWVVGALSAMVLGAHAWGTVQRVDVWDNSESLWRDVTEKSPKNGRGLMNYGLTLMAKGEIEEAVRYFEMARNTNYGNHPYVYTNLGIATNILAERQGSEDLASQAEKYFLRALRAGPNYSQTNFRYADWLHKQGRDEEALQFVNKALRLSPAYPDALRVRTSIIQSDDIGLDEARRVTEQENTAEAFLNLSLKYYNFGEHQLSIEAAREALQLRPDYSLALNNICSSLNMLGRFDEAIAACGKALELDPDFELARANLVWAERQKQKR